VAFTDSHHINKLIFKFDITDIEEEDIPLLPAFCEAFPKMGYNEIKD
jgi:hypothetical protein